MTPSVGEIILRLGCAMAAGFVLGWERESHGRPAGLRTNMLACVASATAMLVSEVLLNHAAALPLTGAIRADPARLGAGILTGFGFLGAGTILRHENFVRGVTTAATLWFGAVLGLAFGSGLFFVGFSGTVIAVVTLLLLPHFEKFVPSDWYAQLTITGDPVVLTEEDIRNRLGQEGMTLLRMSCSYDLERRQKTVVSEVKLKRREAVPVSGRILNQLAQTPGIIRIEWK